MTTPMTTPSEPRTPNLYHATARPTVGALGGVALAVAAIATALLVGSIAIVAGASLVPALAIGQLAMLATTALAVRAMHPDGATTRLGFGRPPGRAVVGALLLGATAWYLNLRVAVALAHAWPWTQTGAGALQSLATDPALGWTLVAVALLPAVCEEIVFRGVLARGLASRLRWPVAAGLSALLFAAYHMNLAQLAPTLLLGFLYAAIAIRVRSAVPTMLAHLINNTAAILLAREEGAPLARILDSHPRLALASAVGVATAGLVLGLTSVPHRRII